MRVMLVKPPGKLDEISLGDFCYKNTFEDLSELSAKRLRFFQKYAYFNFYFLTTRFIKGLFRIRTIRQIRNILSHLVMSFASRKNKNAEN